MIKLIYITSGKAGLHAFTYKELELLETKNIDFILCLTQFNKGMFNPKRNWPVFTPKLHSVILGTLFLIFNKPKIFLKLFIHSLKNLTTIYLAMSLGFYHNLRDKVSSIHCQMGDHKLNIGYYLSRMTDKKLSVTIHAHELTSKYIYNNLKFYKSLLDHCEKIITISEFNRKILVDTIRISPGKIRIMYLYPTNFANDYHQKKHILIVANWYIKKGYEFLLKTLSELKRDDYILWIVGGYLKTQTSINVEELVYEYNLEKKVKILGSQPNEIINILYNMCDFFCLPSVTDYYSNGDIREKEGIPVAIMEAMKWGKPVISTYHAGIPELLDEFLVEENNIDQLKAAIIHLLDNPNLYKEYGEHNQKLVEQKFTQDNVKILVDTIEELSS